MNGQRFFNPAELMRFKHISFDLWLTLIKSHPEFKERRALLFKTFFGIRENLNEVAAVIKYYDDTCNKINELTGRSLDAFEIYLLILAKFGIFPDISQLQEFYTKTETLLFEYPPILLNHFDERFFTELKKQKISCNILSNTGFIKGKTLRSLLNNYFVGPCFDFQLYSDEEGISKPHKAFFQKIFSYFDKPIASKAVIHIGDNRFADYNGALQAGLSALLIAN